MSVGGPPASSLHIPDAAADGGVVAGVVVGVMVGVVAGVVHGAAVGVGFAGEVVTRVGGRGCSVAVWCVVAARVVASMATVVVLYRSVV